jgi:hypothetical protein
MVAPLPTIFHRAMQLIIKGGTNSIGYCRMDLVDLL